MVHGLKNFLSSSDIDLAFYFDPAPSFSDWLAYQNMPDEFGLLQKIDVLPFAKVRNPELQEHFERVRKVLYECRIA